MKITPSLKTILRLGLVPALVGAAVSLQAGSFSTDFNSGLPAGSSAYGNAAISPNDGTGAGYTNSGCLQLTIANTNQHGTFIITNDLDAGSQVVSFTASFKARIGGSSARWEFGNGFSFNFAPDLPLGTWGCCEDGGAGSGLRVRFETAKDDVNNPGPTIQAYWGNTPLASPPAFVDDLRANTFVDCVVQYNPDSTLTVIFDGAYIYSNIFVGVWPAVGSIFGFGSRTGDWIDNHFIDDLRIVTHTTYNPFVNSFAPRGRQVQPNDAINVVLTDVGTQVVPGTVALTLDGVVVSASTTQDGFGNTLIHFAPASPFATNSKHSVSLTFSDNASTPQTFSWQFTVAEALPTNFVTVFTDGFEAYQDGYLDKNLVGDPNYAPNGSGNLWFGPYPENYLVLSSDSLTVDGTNCNITPHSGTKMLTTAWPGVYNCTIWVDLAYRFHSGEPIRGNCSLDWWFFDANDRANPFKDYISLYFYKNSAAYPYKADWPTGWDATAGLFQENGFGWGINEFQSLSLGGSKYSQTGGNYDANKYQIRLEEMAGGGSYGIDGWCNTIERTQGWHHNRIVLGPPHANGMVMVYFYIDDMSKPLYSGLSTISAQGINLLEIDTGLSGVRAFYDDLSFALVRPPNVTTTPGPGKHITVSWTGEGFTLQSAPSLTGPWTDIPGATSGYSYDTTSGANQFFRLRN
jgi:hypothetical protein